MADREEDDLQMALRMSLQGSPPEAKRSKPLEAAAESREMGSRRLQRELMAAAAEKRIRSAAKPTPVVVNKNVGVLAPSSMRSENFLSREEEERKVEKVAVDIRKEEKKVEKEERREVDIGEELSTEVVNQLFMMVFGSSVSRDILAQWTNQGIRYHYLEILSIP